jgi:hypothetical protein
MRADDSVTGSGLSPAATAVFLDAERLDVYRVALEFRALVGEVQLGRGARELRDQLDRASISIVLNIAEGAGRRGGADRARFGGPAALRPRRQWRVRRRCRPDQRTNDANS